MMSFTETLPTEWNQHSWVDVDVDPDAAAGNGHSSAHEPHEIELVAKSLLAGELGYREMLSRVARMAIGALAEGCLLDVLSEEGSRLRLSVLPKPSSARRSEADLVHHFSASPAFPPAVLEVLASGKPRILSGFSESRSRLLFGDDPLPLPTGASFRSAMIVPLRARGSTLGALTLLALSPERSYEPASIARAERLAGPCALALDNARRHALVTSERDQAHESNLAKDEFLAMMGHELRNFIVPILGWARSLNPQTVDLGGELAQGVRAIEANAEAIARLVEDCLEYSRRPRAQLRMDRETLDASDIARQSVDAVRKTALAKGLLVDLALWEKPLWVSADRTRLSQVLTNLLANSIKYTAPGGTIVVRSKGIEGKVEVEVRDTGRGLTPALLGRLRGPATRRGASSRTGGGLGLVLSRRIVEMHEGELSAESPGVDQGSTFVVRLPAAPPPTPAAEPAPPRSSLPLHPMHVLLIDDSSDVLTLMKMEMERLGYVVSTARDGLSGLQAAVREQPDAIVSDILLPDVDGLELVRRMRQIPELSETPAIAVTGLGMRQDVEEALACGYHAHLAKPVDVLELSSMIQSLDRAPSCG
jgi:signal transduction histidine kinase/CheY-like chemotaxis protein